MVADFIGILLLIFFVSFVLFVLKLTGCFDNKNDLRK